MVSIASDQYRLLVRRFAAWLIDVVIVVSVLAVTGGAVASGHRGGRPLSGALLLTEWVVLVGVLVSYWTVLAAQLGGTPGQRVFRLRLIVATVPGTVPPIRARVARCIYAPLAMAPFGLGYVWSILDRKYLTWVDHLTNTTVARRSSEATKTASEEPPAALDTLEYVDLVRLRAVADALERGRHWRPAGVLLRFLAVRSPDRGLADRAAWNLARSPDALEALELTKVAAAAETGSGLTHAARALAYATAGSPVEATTEQARAIAAGIPGDVDRHVAAAIALAHGTSAALHEASLRLASEDPASAEASLLQARLAMADNDVDTARRCARIAHSGDPASIEAVRYLAHVLAPRRRFHGCASPEELHTLADILRIDPTDGAARTRMSQATFGQRNRNLTIAVFLVVWSIATLASAATQGRAIGLVAGSIIAVAAIAMIVWNRTVQSRLDARTRPWAAYFTAMRAAHEHRQGGRTVSDTALQASAPQDSVLGSPERCFCNSLQHISGPAAVRYARAHLIDGHLPAGPGIVTLRCPDNHAAYIGIDADIIDGTANAHLFRVEPRDLTQESTQLHTGQYL